MRWTGGGHTIVRHVDPAGQSFLGHEFRPEDFFDGFGHPRPRLARPNHHDAADGTQRQPQFRMVGLAALGPPYLADAQNSAVHAEAIEHKPLRPDRLDPGQPDALGVATKLRG